MTRDEIIKEMLRVLACRPSTAGRALDVVLDQVLAMATPRLEREWTGSEVLQQLRAWRGHK